MRHQGVLPALNPITVTEGLELYFLSLFHPLVLIKLWDSNWILMKVTTKSALWAMTSIPISLLGYLQGHSIMMSGGPFLIPFLPAVAAIYVFGSNGFYPFNSERAIILMGFGAQYIGYFVVSLALCALHEYANKAR